MLDDSKMMTMMEIKMMMTIDDDDDEDVVGKVTPQTWEVLECLLKLTQFAVCRSVLWQETHMGREVLREYDTQKTWQWVKIRVSQKESSLPTIHFQVLC